RALLDTNAFLWWLADRDRLTATAREFIRDPEHVLYLSVASAWEIAIKAKTGKLTLPESPDTYIPSRIAHYDFQVLDITMPHVLKVWSLPPIHRDPFDRIIIAQSEVESLPVISSDRVFAQYGANVIWK
ncbi:MAG: type II toxin-antitoxin system VapC family toxin, partial [Cyanobacteria bacterium J06639_1]